MNRILLETARKAQRNWSKVDGYHQAAELIGMLCDEIESMQSESPRDWTPCAEGLPRRGEVVLVSYLNGDKEAIAVSEWIGVYGWSGMYDQEAVIAWMPCPAPYNPDHIVDANKKVNEDEK